jgi:hypothetical protein
MWADLVPEWIGLILTPLAVVGAIVLLGTSGPCPTHSPSPAHSPSTI